MSNPKYDWWGYVKGIIRRYPALRKDYDDIHTQCIVPHYSGMPSGGGDPRKVESVASRTLPGVQQKEFESMEAALRLTRSFKDGAERIELIDLMFWRKTHTLAGAALKVHVSERTAQRWHADFIKCVAGFYGFVLDEKEKTEKVGAKS